MKNFIFVDFDKLVTNNYKGEFTGFDDAKLEALASVIKNEVVAMGKNSEVEIMLITAVPEKEVLGKFIEEGYAFANNVAFLGKEDTESTASAIFNFVLNNIRDVNDYIVLGTATSRYVRIPSDKVILVDENKTIDAESIITKLISIRHKREMAVEKILENVGKLKKEFLANQKEPNKPAEPKESKSTIDGAQTSQTNTAKTDTKSATSGAQTSNDNTPKSN